MKKISLTFTSAIVLAIFILLFYSCGSKRPINGDLDGEWEVMEVTPKPPYFQPLENTRIFYSFYMHVCQLTAFGWPFTEGNMVYDGETLWIDFPYLKTPEELLQLEQYGVGSNPVSFTVDFKNKRSLVLYNDDYTITLRKF